MAVIWDEALGLDLNGKEIGTKCGTHCCLFRSATSRSCLQMRTCESDCYPRHVIILW